MTLLSKLVIFLVQTFFTFLVPQGKVMLIENAFGHSYVPKKCVLIVFCQIVMVVKVTCLNLRLLNTFWNNVPTFRISACHNILFLYNVFFFLQVLDLGFNLIRILPPTAFKEAKLLTLLALDGNPMASVPEEAFSHLNTSLRGLSLGGRFLVCDW